MKLTISKRLIFGHVAIMLFVIFLGIYLPIKLSQIDNLTRAVTSVDSTAINLSENFLDTLFSQVSFDKKYVISRDKDFHMHFEGLKSDADKLINQLGDIMDTVVKKEILHKTKRMYDQYNFKFSQEVYFITSKQRYDSQSFIAEKNILVDEINKNLKELIKIARSERDKKIQALGMLSLGMLKIIPLTAILSIVVGILVSYFNSRSITQSTLLLQEKTKEVAKGKFEKVPDITSPWEIKELADHFNAMCDRLKELDKMKSDFVSHVSHEPRTPLTAIKEASCMLLEGYSDGIPERRNELLLIVNQECERLINSVNRILDLSRMEANMMNYNFTEASLIPVVQRSVLKLAPIALKNNINLELIPPPELPDVRIDEERIGQVFQNLIGNALKFTTAGDSVLISLSLKNPDKRYIEVSVSDTGCGIEKQNLDIIFDKFKRIESGIETARGTGLGLSIAKYIITAHGGKIWAESEPKKGSSFFFTLPLQS